MAATTIGCLPTELLFHVLSFLDRPAPSDLRLHNQPHADMLKESDPRSRNLKNVSVVNRQWRATVLPLLFRSAVWSLEGLDLLQREHLKDSPAAIPLLLFIQDNSLMSYVRSLTLVIGATPATPEPSWPFPRDRGGESDLIFNEDYNWLWRLVFDNITPARLTIIASPRVLASLLARRVFLGNEWGFNQSHHVLSLSMDGDGPRRMPKMRSPQEERAQEDTGSNAAEPSLQPALSTAEASGTQPSSTTTPPRIPCKLFTLRPWTSLLLNEGSSTPVYKTYEYFHKRPPSVLGALLGAGAFPNNEPLVPTTVRAFSYVAIFPLASHVCTTLVLWLPRVERLFVQLVPRGDLLDDRRAMAQIDMNDLWAERNMAYAEIMPMLFVRPVDSAGNWPFLLEFESGDADDRESWEMAVDYVNAREHLAEWKVERQGLFIRQRS
ncbi:hypothetical protein M406DRAFT_253623 [Cryphonectria parasitica EP155]|uniref:F-box domain-containing protein n=1 Tax=Cryphonectria parasitica (strain ATCC 38755 / EP155) TaxID=660469 RepID=A0A9P5CQR8_CRYP1|nr:uncharacterized protein M406DRAFT_253623 [Cryphonectria parasitica EP155]KAF3766742.1 hypothetical protein M406DRAFT_253623 [Cryphonectria parasitica EP155]